MAAASSAAPSIFHDQKNQPLVLANFFSDRLASSRTMSLLSVSVFRRHSSYIADLRCARSYRLSDTTRAGEPGDNELGEERQERMERRGEEGEREGAEIGRWGGGGGEQEEEKEQQEEKEQEEEDTQSISHLTSAKGS